MKPVLLGLATLVAVLLLKRALARWFAPVLGVWIGRAFGRTIGRIALAGQPDTLHLDPVSADSWSDFETATDLARPLAQQGFASAGTYRIEEMPGVIVQLLAHREQRLYAAVYEHPQAGHWIDVVARYEDGTGATFTTAKPSGLDPHPGHLLVNAPGLAPRALLDRVLFERPAGALLPAAIETAAHDFEEAYREETAWRKGRGISRAEVVAVARQAA
jgi:hypothetical protein